MQNYDCGTNLSSIAPAPESLTPFVADNGTLNFLTPGDDGSLLRIFQDPHSTSGYSVQKVHGEEMRRSDNPANPGTQPAMTAARAVVLPGHAGDPRPAHLCPAEQSVQPADPLGPGRRREDRDAAGRLFRLRRRPGPALLREPLAGNAVPAGIPG